MKNIAIIGSGSWGVALAIHLAKLGNNIKIWSFMEEERDLINNEHKCKFLPNITLPKNITCSTDYKQVNMKKFLRKLVYHGLVQNQKINEEIEKMKLEVEKNKNIVQRLPWIVMKILTTR